MKYIVKVDYKYFEFDDRFEALDFADIAIQHSCSPVIVEIEVRKEAPENV